MSAIFINVKESDKESYFLQQIQAITQPKLAPRGTASLIDTASFLAIPNAVFGYWVSDHIRGLFQSLLPIGESEVEARAGLCTGDDFRFVRLKWEIEANSPGLPNQAGWTHFAKGGSFGRFYSDIHLVVNWLRDGDEITIGAANGSIPGARPQNIAYYKQPGLTWPLRTTSEFGVRIMPAGCISGHKGPAAYANPFREDLLLSVLAIFNSRAFRGLLSVQLAAFTAAARSYEVGVIQRNVLPRHLDAQLAELALTAWRAKRSVDNSVLTSHAFFKPALAKPGSTLACGIAARTLLLAESTAAVASAQAEIDEIAHRLYGLETNDRQSLEASLTGSESVEPNTQTTEEDTEEDDASSANIDAPALVAELLDYIIGCSFGRWDIRCATGERQPPELPDPFDPLPVCPPGMLQGEDGLPLGKEDGRRMKDSGRYPLRVAWDGVLVEDKNHPEDLIGRVQEVIGAIWADLAEGIETEACQVLGVRTLREYFRKSFFADHLKRYSKSRRQAPIYWPLSTASGSYTIWIYYHRFSKDTFYRVCETVDEKLRHEERKLFSSQQDAGPNPSTKEAKALGEQAKLVEELREFRAEVARVLPLWYPNFNDGVIINFAPFHRLISHPKWRKHVTACWRELVKGNYDWSHLAMHLWPERVIPKCATDLSLAIAHGLDETFWEPDPDKKGKYRLRGDDEMRTRQIEKLVSERKNPAVRAALAEIQSSLTAGPARKKRKAKR
jgi:hypothetical protein